MAVWRMAMRGRHDPADDAWLDAPREMWPLCRERGVAAITYAEVQNDNFDDYSRENPPPGWTHLATSRKQSLSRFVYEMQVGDTIYVKEGPRIAGKGIVRGCYRFDEVGIPGALGAVWHHQRPVTWLPFTPRKIQLGRQQIVAIVPLTFEDVKLIERVGSA